MPAWVAVVLWIAALVGAVGVIWQKAVRPLVTAIALATEMLPLLRDLTVQMKDTPQVFSILSAVAAQFRTDSGSSLRDVVNRLDEAAIANANAAEVLKVQVESARELAAGDRHQLARLGVLLDRLEVKVDAGISGVERIEAEATSVARDLHASHDRADAVEGEPGAAADAAVKRGDE